MNCCGGAFVLGLGSPMLILLFLYTLLAIYVIYYTYINRSDDLKEWKRSKIGEVDNHFEQQIGDLDQKIAKLD